MRGDLHIHKQDIMRIRLGENEIIQRKIKLFKILVGNFFCEFVDTVILLESKIDCRKYYYLRFFFLAQPLRCLSKIFGRFFFNHYLFH